jgi:hypothetical protein
VLHTADLRAVRPVMWFPWSYTAAAVRRPRGVRGGGRGAPTRDVERVEALYGEGGGEGPTTPPPPPHNTPNYSTI